MNFEKIIMNDIKFKIWFKIIMPRRKLSGGRRRRVRRGGSLWSWIKGAANTVYNKAIKPAHNFLKNNHVYSSAAALIPHPAGKVAAAGLRAAGYGRRRRKVGAGRRRVGGSRRMRGGMSSLNGRLFLV
jgi:hypothetical protein